MDEEWLEWLSENTEQSSTSKNCQTCAAMLGYSGSGGQTPPFEVSPLLGDASTTSTGNLSSTVSCSTWCTVCEGTQGWMRVCTDDPKPLDRVIQSYKPCYVFVPTDCGEVPWTKEFVPPLVNVIPIGEEVCPVLR